jgi:uncharacterized protein YjbI with pentapeptide repeats
VIEAGVHLITTDLIVPADHVLTINSGATLRFGVGVMLISTSPVHLLGNENSLVILEPSSNDWGGVFVQRAGGDSRWEHAIIRDTTGIELVGQTVTGAVTFNESSLTLRHVVFDGSDAEDALNVILAGIDFEYVTFTRAVSDGFDGDSVVGRISHGRFSKILGDGLDLSASNIDGIDLDFDQIGDKAISVGEASTARLSDIVVTAAGIGIASKDLSRVDVTDADFIDITNFPLASYQKKPEYGPAVLKATNITTDERRTSFVLDDLSELRIDGQLMASADQDLADLFLALNLAN